MINKDAISLDIRLDTGDVWGQLSGFFSEAQNVFSNIYMIGKEISGAIGKAFPSMEWPTKSISEDTSAIVSCLQEIELAVSDGFDQLAAQSEKEGGIDAIFKGWEIANDIYEKVPQNKKAMAEENASKKRLMMEMGSLASPPTRICLQRGCST